MGRLRIGVVGCGDVSHRRYFPTLAAIPDRVELAACCDPRPDAAAEAVSRWAPDTARPYTDVAAMLDGARPEAVYNLTPAPIHAAVTRACLEAGAAVYSEKPLAGTVAEATELIDLARSKGLTLLCAPGSAALRRTQWLREIVESARFGPVTLVTAHNSGKGPAGWREYTGDPAVFYGPRVGPLFDHGVYRLHELTTILGPIRRVQAMGNIALRERTVRAGRLAGRTIEVTAPDNVVLNLEFASGTIGTLLASFAAPATQVPWLELHFRDATVSFRDGEYSITPTCDVFHEADGTGNAEGWERNVASPPAGERWETIETGAMHFVEVLEGRCAPILTAEQARHVLDVILQAYASIADNAAHLTETTF